MTITANTVRDVDGVLRPNVGGISWSLWGTFDPTLPPTEGGAGLSTDADGTLVIPSVANEGLLLLYRNDTDMGSYVVQADATVDTPQNLQWQEPFPGFYLLYWQWPFPEDPDFYIIERDGVEFGITTLRVFATFVSGTYTVRAVRGGVRTPTSNPVTIP